MIVYDTLTENEKNIVGSELVGIFNTLFVSTDLWYHKAVKMCFDYYMLRSKNKTVPRNIVDIILKEGKQDANILIGGIIRSQHVDAWRRIYDDLITTTYHPLDEEKIIIDIKKNFFKNEYSNYNDTTNTNSYGYNSIEPTPTGKVVALGDKTISQRIDENGENHTETISGHRKQPYELLSKEIEFRIYTLFSNIVFKDIDDVLSLKYYI